MTHNNLSKKTTVGLAFQLTNFYYEYDKKNKNVEKDYTLKQYMTVEKLIILLSKSENGVTLFFKELNPIVKQFFKKNGINEKTENHQVRLFRTDLLLSFRAKKIKLNQQMSTNLDNNFEKIENIV